MPIQKKLWFILFMISIVPLIATPAFARSVSLKDAGIALWIFIIIGAIIVLLQLVPAALLFFSFIGTTTGLVFKRKKNKEEVEEKAILRGAEQATVKK